MTLLELIDSSHARAVIEQPFDDPNVHLERVDHVADLVDVVARQTLVADEHVGVLAHEVHLEQEVDELEEVGLGCLAIRHGQLDGIGESTGEAH